MDSSILAAAAAAFGADPAACRPERGGNFSHVYGFELGRAGYILRITPPDPEMDVRWLQATLAFMAHLARGGVSVPAPRPAAGGELVVSIPSGQGLYLAACFERAPGVLAEELPFSSWDDARFVTLGRAVGQFHTCAQKYAPPPGFERPHWDECVNCFHPSETIADPLLARRHAEALAAVQGFPRSAAGYGLIHTDLHGGNFMLEPSTGQVTLLDFDDCSLGWHAMDIAMLLHDFCVLTPEEDKNAFGERFLRCFLQGYLPAHPLERGWIEHLPLFLKLLETGIYAQVASFADSAEPNSWVGRFMHGTERAGRIARGAPVLEIDFSLVVQ